MDFVVAGFGLGAVLVLIGFAVRDLGPLRHRRTVEDSSAKPTWPAVCRVAGGAFVLAGVAICVGTAIVLVAGAGDDVGARVVAAVSVVSMLGGGVWGAISLRRISVKSSTAEAPGIFAQQSVRPRTRNGWPEQPPARRARGGRWGPSHQPAEFAAAPGEDVDASPAEALHDEPAVADALDVNDTPETPPSPEPLPGPEPMPEPGKVAGSRFQSPLLADVDVDAQSEDGAAFRSHLFADLSVEDRRAAGERRFASSVLADLTSREEAGSDGEQASGADADRVHNSDSGQPNDQERGPATPDKRTSPAKRRDGKPGGGGLTAAG